MKDKYTIVQLALLLTMSIAFGSKGVLAEELIGNTSPINLKTAHPYVAGTPYEEIESFEVTREGATFIVVHFSNFSLNDGDYVEIRDSKGILRQVITNDDPGKPDFWAFAVDGETAYVRLISDSEGAQAYGFDIDQYGYGIARIGFQSICFDDEKVDIECVHGTTQYERARSVGLMYYQKNGAWYLCTGSLISASNHFLTNEHCVNTQSAVDTLQVRFNYQYNSCDGSTLALYETFYADTFLVADYPYDCALMTLKGDPQAIYGYLDLDPRDMALGEPVYIAQHPRGQPKKYDDNIVVEAVVYGRVADSDFGYQVDTEGGSSGSPVLSADHLVVGLHHFGGCTVSGGQNQGVLMKHVYPIIAPYLFEPEPDIKANGSDGPFAVQSGDSVSVTISLDPGGQAGQNADWWVAVHTPPGLPFHWYTYVYPGGWQPGIHVCVQRPVFHLVPPFQVLDTILPPGDYTFYFAVDDNADGIPDASWLDSVAVRVE